MGLRETRADPRLLKPVRRRGFEGVCHEVAIWLKHKKGSRVHLLPGLARTLPREVPRQTLYSRARYVCRRRGEHHSLRHLKRQTEFGATGEFKTLILRNLPVSEIQAGWSSREQNG